jgi:hypothetical protein
MSSAAIAAGRARELLGPERYDARRAEEAAMSVDEVVAPLVREIDDVLRDRVS